MVINKAVRCRAYPNVEQERKIVATLGACRFVYNHMLSRNQKVYERRGKHLSYNEMQNLLPVMKQYLPWLKDIDARALQYACRQLDSAYKRFFKKLGGYPNFHSKRGKQSFTTTYKEQIRILDRHHVSLPKIGVVYVRGLKPLPSNAKTGYATVSREPDGSYYISIAYEFEIPEPEHKSNQSIGLDYKVNSLYVDSNGYSPKIPKWFSESQTKLMKVQRRLSRKTGSRKGERKSSNWYKQMHKVAKVYRKIADQRNDFLHKESKRLVETYRAICIEDLSIQDMNVDLSTVGTHRTAHAINRAILDTGWYGFTQILSYKAKEYGGSVIKVGKYYRSSQTCSTCGHVETSTKDLSLREWTCPCCGTYHDRDHNAAINILNEGLRLLKAS